MSATALATETAVVARRSQEHSSARLFEPSGSTLEDRILGAWEDLALRGRTECPVCQVQVLTADGCANCGSHLT